MKKQGKFWIILIILAITVYFAVKYICCGGESYVLLDCKTDPARAIETAKGTDLVYEEEEKLDGGDIKQRLYRRENGDELLMARYENSDGDYCVKRIELESDGKLCYYNQNYEYWVQNKFSEGTYSASMIELDMEGDTSYLIYTPKTYIKRKNNTLEYLPGYDGYLKLEQDGDNWILGVWVKSHKENSVSDYMMMRSDKQLLNWDHRNCALYWRNYMLNGESRWCYDGYYFPIPEDYDPTGENYFYRSPASYFIKSMVGGASTHPVAENMAIAMLDTMAQEQNSIGFWPTTPESQWLKEDYDILKGFYDTRFNTDLIEEYIKMYRDYGVKSFGQVMNKYIEFYTDYAKKHHYETENGGWFVQDYYHPDGNKLTHVSLNHQVAEIIALYKLAEVMEKPELNDLADKMLLAVTDTTDEWIKDNSDLHYCIFEDGTYGKPDYPYLTYNDLLHLQKLLENTKGKTDDNISKLMDAKRKWMDANSITAYEK